ncbi:hypothetical protein yc1106_03014 [Curvularia clavata]|uniref:Uncharacterized protein n=1 Tax=Curvularia clavata TaxID=95742 RepID=A0A9Q8Z5X3_CURCL|nr:hypothetical protein yc1106_03014 [Curvularia clavata]
MESDAGNNGKKEEAPKVTCEAVGSSDELTSGVRSGDWHTGTEWKSDGTQGAGFFGHSIWKGAFWTKKNLLAVVLVIATGIVPICILGEATTPPYSDRGWFSGIFSDKVVGCSGNIGSAPQNTTVTGIETVFALDTTYGAFTFAQVKAIDLLWDVALGRGLQFLAGWAAYIVFCDALLKTIERHPTSFAVFQRIALEGPSARAIGTLIKELWATKSRRTKALFFYMLLSTAYIISVPIVIGAMTGYDSTAIAWVGLDDSSNIVPTSSLERTWLIKGVLNDTWSEPACADVDLRLKLSLIQSGRRQKCDCLLPNGTIFTAEQVKQAEDAYDSSYLQVLQCRYDFSNNTQTWEDSGFVESNKLTTYSCNSTFPMTIKDKTYDASDLKTGYGYCYNSIAYNETWIASRSRCLPDTANQKYKWGFSTVISALFVFVTTAWVVSMYALWLYAQHNSTLVSEGFRMTPLRAAFAMVKAAKHRTGLCEKGLVRKNTVELEKELYGGKGSKKTKLHYSIFTEDVEEGEDGLLAKERRGKQGGEQRRRDGYRLHPGQES